MPAAQQSDWRRDDWMRGRWNQRVVTVAVAGLLAGCVGARIVSSVSPSPLAYYVVLWSGWCAAIAYALIVGRPMGLLRWRFVDVVWGLTLGVVLRLAHGLLFVAPDTSFPSAASLSGAHALDWIATEAVPIGLLAPIAEEFLFRGVILVGLYAILARRLGSLAAAVSASLLSAGLFVLTHSSFAALSGADVTQLLAIGLINAALVILTGRIWAALVVHVVYNTSWLVLVVVGSVFA